MEAARWSCRAPKAGSGGVTGATEMKSGFVSSSVPPALVAVTETPPRTSPNRGAVNETAELAGVIRGNRVVWPR